MIKTAINLLVLIGLSAQCLAQYDEDRYEYWREDAQLTYDMFQADTSTMSKYKEYNFKSIVSTGLWGALDIPKKKRDRRIKMEMYYFCAALDKTEGGETIGGGGGGGQSTEGWQTGTTTYAGDLTVYDINNVTIQNPVTVCHDEYSSSTTIATNIKNPTTMYWCDKYRNGNNTHVVTTPNKELYINMWNAQQPVTKINNNDSIYIKSNIAEATVKTVYDPCPPGFCVPTDNLYEYIAAIDSVSFYFSEDFVGRQLTTATPNVFFPCVGRRAYDTGRVTSVNSSGLFSATAVAPNNPDRYGLTRNALFFSFGKTTTGRTRTNFSLGYPVRAVAEE